MRGAKQCSDRWRLVKKKTIDKVLPVRASVEAVALAMDGNSDKQEGTTVSTGVASVSAVETPKLTAREKQILKIVEKDSALVTTSPHEQGRVDFSAVEAKMQQKIDEMKAAKQEKGKKTDGVDGELIKQSKEMTVAVQNLTAILGEYLKEKMKRKDNAKE